MISPSWSASVSGLGSRNPPPSSTRHLPRWDVHVLDDITDTFDTICDTICDGIQNQNQHRRTYRDSVTNDAMRGNWATTAEAWVRNERIYDAAFAPFTAAVLDVAELGAAGRVLDVGCGAGTLLEAVVATGVEAIGVDISPPRSGGPRWSPTGEEIGRF